MSHHHRRFHQDVPVELTREILSRLPVKPLVRFLCVSKSWCALIKSSGFTKMQLKHSIETNRDRTNIMIANNDPHNTHWFFVRFPNDEEDHKTIKIHNPTLLGSHTKGMNLVDYCDGLVCVHDDERKEIAIWNPLIRRCKRLPNKPIEKPFRSAEYDKPKFGFGYDPHNDDYKVMRLVEFFEGNKPVLDFEVNIYSLKSHSWKKIEGKWPETFRVDFNSKCSNGAFHWLTYPNYGLNLPQSLIAFDLGTEKFRVFTIPVQTSSHYWVRLEVLGGHLCFVETDMNFRSNVWTMKEYGEPSSWTHIYEIEKPRTFVRYYKHLTFSNDSKNLVLEEALKELLQEVLEAVISRVFQDEKDMVRDWLDLILKTTLISNKTATCVGSLLLLEGDNVVVEEEVKIGV